MQMGYPSTLAGAIAVPMVVLGVSIPLGIFFDLEHGFSEITIAASIKYIVLFSPSTLLNPCSA